MTNRRQFIQSSLIVSALSFAHINILQAAQAPSTLETPTLDSFIFDSRFKEAVQLSQLAHEQGIPLIKFSGDLTDVWYHQLSSQWKKKPMTFAGVTDQSGLFILETLAADHGMRLFQKNTISTYTEQDFQLKQNIYSWIIAPRASTIQRA